MNTASEGAAPRYRPMRFGVTRAELRDGAGGVQYVRAEPKLEAYAQRMTDRFVYWADKQPDRIFMARRRRQADGGTGEWVTITWREALERPAASARRCSRAG